MIIRFINRKIMLGTINYANHYIEEEIRYMDNIQTMTT
jgi:hypothetical protein